MTMTKRYTTAADTILDAMERHISQRSGIQWANYATGDYAASRAAYLSDYRPMLRAGRDARRMLEALRRRADFNPDSAHAVVRSLLDAESAFSGRLRYDEALDEYEYTTGQYFPTEYRAAACAVLARALGYDYAQARSAFGPGLAGRWFR